MMKRREKTSIIIRIITNKRMIEYKRCSIEWIFDWNWMQEANVVVCFRRVCVQMEQNRINSKVFETNRCRKRHTFLSNFGSYVHISIFAVSLSYIDVYRWTIYWCVLVYTNRYFLIYIYGIARAFVMNAVRTKENCVVCVRCSRFVCISSNGCPNLLRCR